MTGGYGTRFSGPPSWWPHGEPWPPRDSRFYRERRRALFVRRSGWYSFLPIWVLLWLLGSVFKDGLAPTSLPIANGVRLLIVCGVAAGVIAILIRRIATPVADIVSAADRIARRDYRVRIDEPRRGPRWVADTARAFNAMAKELESQDAARRHMMADIAHELRTPLAVVQGKLEGLIDGVYPRDNEQLTTVLESTRVLSRLVEDLRTLSTAESGALALTKEPTDLVALANDVVNAMAPRADEAGVSLQVSGTRTDAAATAQVDPVRIREVLTNLVSNALRHTPRGGRVDITVAPQSGMVEIRVTDTGEGIAADELPRIFDRFYKGATSSGSGLGLTIARNLIEAHGGRIQASSMPGRGTSIVFALPT